MASAAASPSTAAAAAKTCLSLRGIISVLNTPFIRSSGSLVVDTASLVGAVQVALDAGVAGFLVAGLAAEVGLLTHEERGALLETVVATVRKAGRPVSVIAGASAPTTEARQALAKAALATGADAVLVNLPFKAGEEAAYTASVHEVANVINEHNAKRGSGTAAWLMLQDWDPVGSGVPTALLSSLFADVPCFRSYKCEVVGAGAKYSAVLAACGGRLHVCGGWAVTQLIEALGRGVHAFMPTAMSEIYCRIVSLHSTDRDAAARLFYAVLPVLAFSNQNLPTSIAFFKHLLHHQQVFSSALCRDTDAVFDVYQLRIASDLATYATDLTKRLDSEFPNATKPSPTATTAAAAGNHLFIVHGLPGSGKTTLTRALATALGDDSCTAFDFDDVMPAELKARMSKGDIIRPDERDALIAMVITALTQRIATHHVAAACVLVTPKHRAMLCKAFPRHTLIHLAAPLEVLKARTQQRLADGGSKHFFNPAALERLHAVDAPISLPHSKVDATLPADAVLSKVMDIATAALGSKQQATTKK